MSKKIIPDFSTLAPFTPYVNEVFLKKYGSMDFLKMRNEFYGIKNPAVKRGYHEQRKKLF